MTITLSNDQHELMMNIEDDGYLTSEKIFHLALDCQA